MGLERVLAGWVVAVSLVHWAQCSEEDVAAMAVGMGECADCLQYKIQPAMAFTGLHIGLACRDEKGELTRIGGAKGTLDGQGRFQIQIPNGLLNEKGRLKRDCFVLIENRTTKMACPTQGGLQATRLVYKSLENGKHNFIFQGKLAFSYLFCDSRTVSLICTHPWFTYHPLCTSPGLPRFGFSSPFLHFPGIPFPPTLNPFPTPTSGFPQTPGSSFPVPRTLPASSPPFPVTESPPSFPIPTGSTPGTGPMSPILVRGSVLAPQSTLGRHGSGLTLSPLQMHGSIPTIPSPHVEHGSTPAPPSPLPVHGSIPMSPSPRIVHGSTPVEPPSPPPGHGVTPTTPSPPRIVHDSTPPPSPLHLVPGSTPAPPSPLHLVPGVAPAPPSPLPLNGSVQTPPSTLPKHHGSVQTPSSPLLGHGPVSTPPSPSYIQGSIQAKPIPTAVHGLTPAMSGPPLVQTTPPLPKRLTPTSPPSPKPPLSPPSPVSPPVRQEGSTRPGLPEPKKPTLSSPESTKPTLKPLHAGVLPPIGHKKWVKPSVRDA